MNDLHDPAGLIAALPSPVLVVDGADRVRFASPAARLLWNEEPVGSALGDLLTLDQPTTSGRFRARLRVGRKSRRFDVTAVALPSFGDRLIILHDVTEYVSRFARLERLALSDPLTRLANRRAFDLALRTEHRRGVRVGTPLSLLALDVNGLKQHNDRHGHAAGDRWLKAVAHSLRQAARRPGDMAARVGGDEFALLLPDTDLPGAETVANLIGRILEKEQGGVTSPATVAIGAASLLPSCHHAASPAALRRSADEALYAAKDEHQASNDPRRDSEKNPESLFLGQFVQTIASTAMRARQTLYEKKQADMLPASITGLFTAP